MDVLRGDCPVFRAADMGPSLSAPGDSLRIMYEHWLAARTRTFDASGIRKVFDLAAKLKDPINLSIGQPDFDVPEEVRQAAIDDSPRTPKNEAFRREVQPAVEQYTNLHVRIEDSPRLGSGISPLQ